MAEDGDGLRKKMPTSEHTQTKQMKCMTKQYFSFQIKHRNFSCMLLSRHWAAARAGAPVAKKNLWL